MFAFTPDLSWTPDGKWLAVSAGFGGQDARMGIVLLSPETGERRQLTTPAAARGHDTAPSFSADGRKLVFGRQENDNRFLLVQDLTRDYGLAGTPRRIDLNAEPGYVDQTAWMPDSTDVIMFRQSENNGSLWRVRADGGSLPEQLTWAGEDVRRFALAHLAAVARNGAVRLAFARMSNRSNIWRYLCPL